MIEVKPGQTWVDCDTRMNGRACRVQRIEEGQRAWRGQGVTEPKAILRDAGGRETRVAVRRMVNGSRWKMVRDENGVRVKVDE